MNENKERAKLSRPGGQAEYQAIPMQNRAQDLFKAIRMNLINKKKINETTPNGSYFNPFPSHYEERNELV
jgi:hypothetical protein